MHFYDQFGQPVYQVPRTDKKGERDTTIRDARKLKLQPSVTTITGVLDKPGLLRYFLIQTIGAVFSQNRQEVNESWETYTTRIIAASRQESERSKRRGSHLHNCLEDFFSGKKSVQTLEEVDRPFVSSVIQEINERIVKTKSWKAEQSFSHALGFGGKVDLYTDKDNGYIVDFKTKATTDKKKFYKYDEHLMQLAAYRVGLDLPLARCFDIYISSEEPGIIEVHEWPEEELKRGEKMFLALLDFWKVSNNHDSSFIKEVSNDHVSS